MKNLSPIRRSTRRPAFTLVELIIVIVILAIAAAVAVPMMASGANIEAKAAASMLCTDLREAQDIAITYQKPVTVTFNLGANSYTLSNESGVLTNPITKSDYVIDFDQQSQTQRCDLFSASFNGAPSVVFDETGVPNNAGSVEVRAGDDRYRYRVEVAAFTGKISVLNVGS